MTEQSTKEHERLRPRTRGLSAAGLYGSPLLRPLRPALRRLKRSLLGRRVATSAWFPPNWRSTFRVCRILAVDYAHLRTAAVGRPIDAQGRPVPWYTYPAIEFLRQLDLGNASVFEYGCGNSTLFWCSIARDVVAVEDEEAWHQEMLPLVPRNGRLLWEPDLDRFVAAIDQFDTFDVVVVDGPARGRTRLKCARAALRHLAKGGMVIVDNADWLPESTALLRDSGLLQIDMTGFSPINAFTGTTSFFFDRTWQMSARSGRRPTPGVGARPYNWEPQGVSGGRQVRCGSEGLGGVSAEEPVEYDLDGLRRHFRLVRYAGGTYAGGTAMAILDDDQERILLTNHQPAAAGSAGGTLVIDQEFRRIRAMSGSEFRDFINRHPQRRYRL